MDRLETLVGAVTRLKRTGRELSGLCPFHDEKTPSFSINPEKQVYFCQSCGAKGNLFTWLVQKEGCTKREAAQRAGLEDNRPQPVTKKPRIVDPDRDRGPWVVAEHQYRDPQGNVRVLVLRNDREQWLAADRPERFYGKCKPYALTPEGWVRGMGPKQGRILYRLPELLATKPDQQVMVVEGEKCADTVAAKWPGAPVTTCIGGASAWRWTDWSPLHGHPVLIVADADKPGRKFARALGKHLSGKCRVRLALPPGDSGDDIHDWLVRDGLDKTRKRVGQLLGQEGSEPKPEAPAIAEKDIGPETYKNEWFTVLGNVGDDVAIMLHTQRVMQVPRTALCQPSTLISLASLDWWKGKIGADSLKPGVCQPVASGIIRLADSLGQLDLNRMAGRGLHRLDSGDCVWHLGDRLWRNGETLPLDHYGTDLLALAGPPIALSGDPAPQQARKRLTDAVLRYRWDQERDGQMFLGWLVASLVAGALDWRPHVWMVARPETGKSWLIKNVAKPVLGPAMVHLADATPAAISRRMASDALPLILDEAEPDRLWIEGIMDVLRVAAGGDGERIRAEGARAVQSFQACFPALLSSSRLANLSGANASRFVFPNLSLQPVKDWGSVRDGIVSALADGMGNRIRAGVMRDAERIVANARRMSEDIRKAVRCSTRQGMIYGALTAGWQWLSGEGTGVLPPFQTEMQGSSTEDARTLLNDIMGLRIRSGGAADHSVAYLLETDSRHSAVADHGIFRDRDGSLCVATGHASLREKLRRTRWHSVDIRKVLLQMNGTVWSKSAKRFGGGVRKRCIVVPQQTLEELGLS